MKMRWRGWSPSKLCRAAALLVSRVVSSAQLRRPLARVPSSTSAPDPEGEWWGLKPDRNGAEGGRTGPVFNPGRPKRMMIPAQTWLQTGPLRSGWNGGLPGKIGATERGLSRLLFARSCWHLAVIRAAHSARIIYGAPATNTRRTQTCGDPPWHRHVTRFHYEHRNSSAHWCMGMHGNTQQFRQNNEVYLSYIDVYCLC